MANSTIPERIGPYEIRERIGEGGMAIVYRAWHSGLHRFEALKVPRPGYGDGEYIQRLLAEARMAARLHHPHIVAIHSISESNAEQHFFAMDLVDGVDLETLLEKRTLLPSAEALAILTQIADALDYAHSQGVIHRDIKPGNILLKEHLDRAPAARWEVKVVDFGISRAAEDIDGTRLTKNGMLVGTPEYMSPEQAGSGEIVDYRTDLYSLAVVAYEMLTGSPPFLAGDGVSRMSILMSHVSHPPRAPRESIPEIPPALNEAILRALAKKPEERFRNAKAFLRAAQTPNEAPENAISPASAVESIAANNAELLTDDDRKTELFPLAEAAAPSVETPTAAPELPTRAPIVPAKKSRQLLFAILLGAGIFCALLWSLAQKTTAPSNLPVATIAPVAAIAPAATIAPVAATPIITATPQIVTRNVVEKRAIAFERQTQRTSALLKGQSRVSQSGRAGVREVTLQIATRGTGAAKRELSRRVIAQRVLTSPRAQITQIGTRTRQPEAAPTRRPARVRSPRREPQRATTRPRAKPKTPTKSKVKVRRPREAPLPP